MENHSNNIQVDTTQVEELAGCFFSKNEVCLILDLPEETRYKPKFKRAFDKGRLQQDAKIRKSILKMASQGSSPAQNLALRLKLNSENIDGLDH